MMHKALSGTVRSSVLWMELPLRSGSADRVNRLGVTALMADWRARLGKAP